MSSSLSEKQVELVDNLYRDSSLKLLTPQALNKYLKDNGHTGFTKNKIKEYLAALETTQTSKTQYSKVSYVAPEKQQGSPLFGAP